MFRYRAEYLDCICLLKANLSNTAITFASKRCNLSGDYNHRHRIIVCRRDARQQVCRTWTACCDDRGRPILHASESICRHCRSLLVKITVVLNPIGLSDRVYQMEAGAARNDKRMIHVSAR
jgi:hypothetical protein